MNSVVFEGVPFRIPKAIAGKQDLVEISDELPLSNKYEG
jgi:hypothetical protein